MDEKMKEALRKGERFIPQFQSNFQQGENHEVYDISLWQLCSRCELQEPNIRYIAQTRYRVLIGLFSELEVDLGNPDFGYVYFQDEFFTFFNVPYFQKAELAELRADFYKAWLYTRNGKFNPKISIFNPINFVNFSRFQWALKKYKDLYKKTRKYSKNIQQSTDSLDSEVSNLVAKTEKKLRKYFIRLELQNNFKELFNRAEILNASEMDTKISRGASKAREVATGIFLGARVAPKRIHAPQLYIFPNGKTTLILHLAAFSWNVFKYYQPFYDTLLNLFERLKRF